jgi:hypothetical protein
MDNLARGWAIVWAHLAHGHWLAIQIPIWTAVAISIWVAMSEARRKPKDEDADDGRLTPKRRAPLEGSGRDLP